MKERLSSSSRRSQNLFLQSSTSSFSIPWSNRIHQCSRPFTTTTEPDDDERSLVLRLLQKFPGEDPRVLRPAKMQRMIRQCVSIGEIPKDLEHFRRKWQTLYERSLEEGVEDLMATAEGVSHMLEVDEDDGAIDDVSAQKVRKNFAQSKSSSSKEK